MAGLKLDTFLFGKIVLNITFRVISICLQQHCVSEKKTSMTIFSFLSLILQLSDSSILFIIT